MIGGGNQQQNFIQKSTTKTYNSLSSSSSNFPKSMPKIGSLKMPGQSRWSSSSSSALTLPELSSFLNNTNKKNHLSPNYYYNGGVVVGTNLKPPPIAPSGEPAEYNYYCDRRSLDPLMTSESPTPPPPVDLVLLDRHFTNSNSSSFINYCSSIARHQAISSYYSSSSSSSAANENNNNHQQHRIGSEFLRKSGDYTVVKSQSMPLISPSKSTHQNQEQLPLPIAPTTKKELIEKLSLPIRSYSEKLLHIETSMALSSSSSTEPLPLKPPPPHQVSVSTDDYDNHHQLLQVQDEEEIESLSSSFNNLKHLSDSTTMSTTASSHVYITADQNHSTIVPPVFRIPLSMAYISPTLKHIHKCSGKKTRGRVRERSRSFISLTSYFLGPFKEGVLGRIKLSTVNLETLKEALRYLQYMHHQNQKKDSSTIRGLDNAGHEVTAMTFKISNTTILVELVETAQYLELPQLVESCTDMLATSCFGKHKEECERV